jgi:hypothetical protein
VSATKVLALTAMELGALGAVSRTPRMRPAARL